MGIEQWGHGHECLRSKMGIEQCGHGHECLRSTMGIEQCGHECTSQIYFSKVVDAR